MINFRRYLWLVRAIVLAGESKLIISYTRVVMVLVMLGVIVEDIIMLHII